MDSGKENTEPGQKMGLARMFHEGNQAIGTHKTDDLFQQLESRSLTEQEEAIIQQRLELQRKMLKAYEAREKTRKVQDLQQVCPDLTEEEAQRALDLCNGREDEAAGQVVSDPAFRRRLQIATTSASAQAHLSTVTAKRSNKWHAKPSARRPKQVDTASLGSSVFVGSFRGGKRGGSRTAHLKGPASDAPQPCSDLPHARANALRANPGSRSHAAAADPTSNAQSAAHDSTTDWADDSDAIISDSSEAEAEEEGQDTDQQGPSADHGSAADEDDLKFEVDVVDTLGDLSQAMSPAKSTGIPGHDKGVKESSSRHNGVTSAAAAADAVASFGRSGTRQSRRLAAFAEAQSHADSPTLMQQSVQAPVPSAAATVAPCSQLARNAATTGQALTAAQAAAEHREGSGQERQQGQLQQQGQVRTQQGQAPPQLSQAVLEASASAMRTLTVPRAILFLQKMQPSAREGTWAALQEMDPAKASQLEAAMQQSADSAAVQPDAQLTAPPAPLPQGDADAALPNRAMPKDRLRLTKPAPTKQDSHVSLGIPSAPPGVHGSGTSDAQQPKQATQKQTNHNAKGVGQLNADGSVTQASSVSATDTNRITEQASATASSPPVDAQLSEPDTQLSISPGSKVSPDQDPPSRGKSDNTAGKSETHWADEEPSSSKQRATGTTKRAWQSKRRSANRSQQVTLDRAFARQEASQKQQQPLARDSNTEQQQRRSTQARAAPVHVLEASALVSDSEPEQQTESDSEFMAGPGKRGRAGMSHSSPAKKRKTEAAAHPASASPINSEQKDGKSEPHPAKAEGSKRKRQTSHSEADKIPQLPGSPRPAPDSPGAVRRSPRAVKKTAKALESEAVEAEELAHAPVAQCKAATGQGKRGARPSGGNSAIARSGHTNRGRVKQKSHKAAHILEVGFVRAEKGWFNSGYIFPEGFKSQLPFRSSVDIDQLCLHECTIIGTGGAFWPQPTYKVVAMDRPDEALIGKSCTSCWTQVLKRINSEIEARRNAGENLPPPPKTAIAGPEYFGLNQPELAEQIEALDLEQQCSDYWLGKADREAAAAGLPPAERAPRHPPRPSGGSARAPTAKRSKRNRQGSGDEAEEAPEEEEGDEASYMTNRWSAVSRTERYRKRCGDEGNPTVDESNPLPRLIDPVTLEPVVTPAISPWGHVMGMATWKAVLAEQGKCPFTKNDLSWEQCTTLSLSNIDRYRSRIKNE